MLVFLPYSLFAIATSAKFNRFERKALHKPAPRMYDDFDATIACHKPGDLTKRFSR